MNDRDNVYGIMLLILVELLLITACIRTGLAPTPRHASLGGLQGQTSGNPPAR